MQDEGGNIRQNTSVATEADTDNKDIENVVPIIVIIC